MGAFFLRVASRQQTGHLSVVSEKMELHVDELVRQVSDGLRNWCLFGARAMLSHMKMGSFLVDTYVARITGEESLLCFAFQRGA